MASTNVTKTICDNKSSNTSTWGQDPTLTIDEVLTTYATAKMNQKSSNKGTLDKEREENLALVIGLKRRGLSLLGSYVNNCCFSD